MNHQDFAQLLGNYGEFVGAIAVVVTLGYLALQVKLSREATEANTRSLRSAARIESGRYWTEEVIRAALSPDMSTIVSHGLADAKSLNDDQRERLVNWFAQHMLAKDTLFQQYQDGLLSKETWDAHEQVTKGMLQYDSFLRVWDAGYIPASSSTSEHDHEVEEGNQVVFVGPASSARRNGAYTPRNSTI